MPLWQALYLAQDWLLRQYLDDMTYNPQEESQKKVSGGPYPKPSPVLWSYVADLRYADEP